MKKKITPDINLSNYEEYLLLSLDGELAAEDETALFAFLDLHPELQTELDSFEAIKVPLPAGMPVFEGKEALLKSVPARANTRSFQPFIWSAAAMLLLWVGIRSLRDFPEKTVGKTEAPIAATPQQTVSGSPLKPVTAGNPAPSQIASLPTISNATRPRTAAPLAQNTAAAPVADSLSKENIAALPIAPTNTQIPESAPLLETAPLLALALPEPGAPNATSESGLQVNLPVFDGLRETVSAKAFALRDAHRNLKNTEATLVVGNRELFTIRF